MTSVASLSSTGTDAGTPAPSNTPSNSNAEGGSAVLGLSGTVTGSAAEGASSEETDLDRPGGGSGDVGSTAGTGEVRAGAPLVQQKKNSTTGMPLALLPAKVALPPHPPPLNIRRPKRGEPALAASNATAFAPWLVAAHVDGRVSHACAAPTTLWLASGWGAWEATTFTHVVCVRGGPGRVHEGADEEGVKHMWIEVASGRRVSGKQITRVCRFVGSGTADAGRAVLVTCVPGAHDVDVLMLCIALLCVERGECAYDVVQRLNEEEQGIGEAWRQRLILGLQDIEVIREAVKGM
ncbi:hypothetical protein K488DRAFT_83599 [Vararia minispora EC-137]|uniref:Uncharacterized protein n=1 Tax=Vararia minispora EC-137 TaxID=1314806 RepID=A0ACB8QSK4_9AGAM|nr:hypothetical protein K488DRAFT_83599 [Vararia minispora EC-137]